MVVWVCGRLGQTGCLVWAFEADAGTRSTPVVVRAAGPNAATVYFGDAHAQVYALDAATGALKWKVKVEEHLDAMITGGVVFHDVINVKHARKAVEHGVDGLILVCAGAGGHAGTLSPFALLREVKQWFKGTILLSGAISDGWGIASALALGADMAYMGTRFIATAEANADPAYKSALTTHTAEDIVYSNLFTGVHGNYLGPSIVAAGLDPDNLPLSDKTKMNFGSGGNTKAKAWRDIWGSGQGIGQIADAPPVAELVERLKAEFTDASSDFLNRARA